MANRTNPAARLHSLLYEYRRVAQTKVCIIHTWKEVFGVADDRDATRRLCQVAGLIDEIDIAIQAYGDEGVREQFEHHVQAWTAAAIFSSNAGFVAPSPGVELIDLNALVALQGISSYLSVTMPIPGMPSNEKIESLRQQIHEIINSVVAADDLPDDFRKKLLQHLYAAAWALDHINIMGPEGVAEATERLLGWSALYQGNPDSPTRPFLKKILPIIGSIWLVFKAGPVIHNAIEAWHGTWLILSPGEHHQQEEK